MKQSCTSTIRRTAAIGAAVAVVTASSAFGIGATAAMADEGSPSAAATTSITTGVTDTLPGGAPTVPTTAPTDAAVTVPTATPTPTAETPSAPATAPAAEPTGEPTPAAPSEGAPTPAAEDGSDLAFTEPSTKDAPLALTATAGTPFSHTFHTTGGNGTVAYAIQDAPSEDWTVNVETGVLSGTPKVAGTFDFEVVALSGSTQITEYVEVTVAPSASFGFTEASSVEAPVVLTASVGEVFTHTFTVTGAPDAVRYELRRSDGSAIPASSIGAGFPAGITLDPRTGVLSGTDTQAASYRFSVVASSGDQTAVQQVRLETEPGRAVGLRVTVDRPEDPQQRTWTIEPDGSVETSWLPNGPQQDGKTSAGGRPTVAQGGSLRFRAAPVDAYGNITVPLDGDWVGRTPLIVTSDIASDVSTHDGWVADVTFPHASTHTLTATAEGLSSTFAVTVVPAAGTTGSLAFTGADPAGPLAWGLGLLASGAAMLVLRARRRRA